MCSAASAFIMARCRHWSNVIQVIHRMHPSDICYNYRLFFLVAKIRYEQRRWTECVSALEHCLKIIQLACDSNNDSSTVKSTTAKLLYFLALAYLSAGGGTQRDEKAKQCLIRATNIDEDSINGQNALRLLLILRWHWCQYQDDDEAELLFDEAVAQCPDVFAYWYARARLFIAQRRYNRAITNLSEALVRRPRDVNAYHLRALLKIIGHAAPQALDDLTTALSIEPDNLVLRFIRGFLYHSQAELQKALEDYNIGITASDSAKSNSNNTTTTIDKLLDTARHGLLHNRALVYLKLRNYRRAAADLARMYLQNPRAWQYAYALSYAWQQAGLLDMAHRLLQSALVKFPACSVLWNSMGMLHMSLQPFQNARYSKHCFERAVHLDPLALCPRTNLALFHLYEGRLWQCANRAASVIHSAPDCPDGYHLRALASFCAGYPLLAMNDINEAFKLGNEREPIMHRALIQLATHDAPSAYADARKALEISSSSNGCEYAAAHYNLGNVYLYAHQQRPAMYHYRRAFELEPRHWEAHYNNLVALFLNEQYQQLICLVDHYLNNSRASSDDAVGGSGDYDNSNSVIDNVEDNKWFEPMRALRARAVQVLCVKRFRQKELRQSLLHSDCVPDYKNRCERLQPWTTF